MGTVGEPAHATLPRAWDERPKCAPLLSIVILGFNQQHELRNSLAALRLQIERRQDLALEIVIVDNGSNPPLQSVTSTSEFNIPIQWIYRTPALRNFRPGSARNVGIKASRGDVILLLDADCIPGPRYLDSYSHIVTDAAGPVVALGHRVFIDGRLVTPTSIRELGGDLGHLPHIRSASNYGLLRDRRLEEFEAFGQHPMPFHCCHGCNLGFRQVDAVECGGFDDEFDGYWGYEDIEFGYRMWKRGCQFIYSANLYVYHQEPAGTDARDVDDATRNFALACRKIPGFRNFRRRLNRSYYGADSQAASSIYMDQKNLEPR